MRVALVVALASAAASEAAPAGLRGQAMQEAAPGRNTSANKLAAWNLNGSDATELAEWGIPCCSHCPNHPFCSPNSGNCYNGQYKPYYVGCGGGGGGSAPAPPPAAPPAPAPPPAPITHSWGCGCEYPYDVCSLQTCYKSQNCYFSRRLEAKVGDTEGGVEATAAEAGGNSSLQALSVSGSAGSASYSTWSCLCQGAAGFCSHTACYMQCY